MSGMSAATQKGPIPSFTRHWQHVRANLFLNQVPPNQILSNGNRMKLAIGADHAGYDMKCQIVPWLEESGHEVVDVGAHDLDPADDFPDFAEAVGQSLKAEHAERGLMICGSGVGASIASNKVGGVRAALCHDTYTARQGVEHNDMNVLCLGGRVIGIETAKEVISAFLGASFMAEERFQRRVSKVGDIEQGMTGKR